MFTVRYCCCGCSLRAGTLILLWVNLILSTIILLIGIIVGALTTSLVLIINVIILGVLLIIFISGLGGVFTEKPAFLIPFVVYKGLWLVMIITAMILYPIFAQTIVNKSTDFTKEHIKNLIKEKVEEKIKEKIPSSPTASPNANSTVSGLNDIGNINVNVSVGYIVSFEIFCILYLAISIHHFLVVYSFYDELQEDE